MPRRLGGNVSHLRLHLRAVEARLELLGQGKLLKLAVLAHGQEHVHLRRLGRDDLALDALLAQVHLLATGTGGRKSESGWRAVRA